MPNFDDKGFVILSVAKDLRREAAGFFTPFGRSHRPEAVSFGRMTLCF
jgi:hypothetical protein